MPMLTETFSNVSLAHQFTRYTVNCTSRDPTSHLITHLVAYIIARCSSLNTTTFFFLSVPHLTYNIRPVNTTTPEPLVLT